MSTLTKAAELNATHIGRIVQISIATERAFSEKHAPIGGELMTVSHDPERTFLTLRGIAPTLARNDLRGPGGDQFALDHTDVVAVEAFAPAGSR